MEGPGRRGETVRPPMNSKDELCGPAFAEGVVVWSATNRTSPMACWQIGRGRCLFNTDMARAMHREYEERPLGLDEHVPDFFESSEGAGSGPVTEPEPSGSPRNSTAPPGQPVGATRWNARCLIGECFDPYKFVSEAVGSCLLPVARGDVHLPRGLKLQY